MRISDILQQKGSSVATIAAADTIAVAARTMADKDYGTLVVLDDTGRVTGILSERDIVRRLHRDGSAVLSALAEEVMTPDPLTCTRDSTVPEVLEMMGGWHVRHMPVVENHALFGLVSMGDLVRRSAERGILDVPVPHLPTTDEDTPQAPE